MFLFDCFIDETFSCILLKDGNGFSRLNFNEEVYEINVFVLGWNRNENKILK